MVGLERAKDFFLRDRTGQYRTLPFFTNVVHEGTGETSTCFVKHWDGDEFYIILPQSSEMATHEVKLPDENVVRVRMMVAVGNDVIDLFDFRDQQSGLVYELVYLFDDGRTVEPSKFTSRPLWKVKKWQLECPSIIFVRLRDDNSQVYNFVKLVSNMHIGIQSQCFIHSKYEGQRTKEQ
jgi:hypothetical protein